LKEMFGWQILDAASVAPEPQIWIRQNICEKQIVIQVCNMFSVDLLYSNRRLPETFACNSELNSRSLHKNVGWAVARPN
jgi:hypothetical protein